MCLILIAYQQHPSLKLIIAANRDEFHDRATAAADYWEDAPRILAGRDLVARGTWLGVSRSGRVAAVTNFRGPGRQRPDARSRGALVAEFLRATVPTATYLQDVAARGREFNGFSLFAGSTRTLGYVSNNAGQSRILGPGVYGLSNALLDEPWPKVVLGRERLRQVVAAARPAPEELFEVLADRSVSPDARLPDTGIGPARERDLAPMFIVGEQYGSRSSTVVFMHDDGRVEFLERRFDANGRALGTSRFEFEVDSPSL
jgi:uncharacterized protein with NRDE domain